MIVLFFIISFSASVIGAISGIGGGVLIKPLMDVASGLNTSVINFLSSTTVLSMASVSILRSRKRSVPIHFKTTSMMALGGVFGGLVGKNLFDFVKSWFGEEKIISISQSTILFLITVAVLLFYFYKEQIKPKTYESIGFSLFIGLLLGGIASFLGIGGGPINLAVLYLFFSMDSKTAALNSLVIIFFSQIANLLFTFFSGKVPDFTPMVLFIMILGGVGGGVCGSLISHSITNRRVDKLFMVLLVLIMVLCLYNIGMWVI